MLTNRFAFAALAVGCLAAAGAGGYLATRQNSLPQPPAASVTQRVAAPPQQQPAPASESVSGAAPAPSAAPAAAPADVKKPEPRVPARAPRTQLAERARRGAPPVDRPLSGGGAGAPAQAPLPSAPTSAATASPADPLPAPRIEDRAAEAVRALDPPQKELEELVVPADSVIGLQIETPTSSEHARIEDRVEARVTRDVRAGGRVAVPSGARAIGSVTIVERGGKFKERARLGVRFHTLVFPDGTRLPISTDTIYREGAAPGNESAAKIGGGAVGGAILGAILGGARGAVIGATTGAGAGTAVVAAGERSAATLPAGTPVTARLLSPVTVTIER